MNDSSRCYTKRAPESSPPLFQNGNLVIQAHHVGWLLSGVFTLIATAVSFWLIYKHMKWYSNKREQRYIIRLLLMVPIYAIVSLLSFILWNQSTPLLIVRDAYEAIVLTAFFYLLLVYLHPDSEGQKEVFRTVSISKWIFPLGWVKWVPKDGLFFLQLMKWGILQYCFLRPTTSIAAVILDIVGLYCIDSWSPGWGHIYITVIQSLSVTVAMYCLIQFYLSVSSLLKPHKPLLKLFSVKAVVFLTFWQATLLGGLSLIGVVKDTKFMTADDINIGIGALAETFEMMLFAVLHLKAFSYQPYCGSPPTYSKLKALGHALDPRETLRELGEGTIYLWHWLRGRDGEDLKGIRVRRRGDLETAFGKTRKYSLRRGDSWYNSNLMEKEPNEKPINGLPDHYLVSALGDYRAVGQNGRLRRDLNALDDDGDWDPTMENEHTPLTLRNLEMHDVSTGSPSRSNRSRDYRPVSSLLQEHELPRVSTELDPRRLTLEDPPPRSTLHTYRHMRGPELRRMYNNKASGLRSFSNPAGLTPGSKHPDPSLQPTKLSEKRLYPSLTTNRTQESSNNDEYHDFDEVYMYDPHGRSRNNGGRRQ